jgi:pyruvate dehydrogenase E2 component (dihydrolipoamide acetyltransferase)
MPRLSDSMEEGTIVRWLKTDGDEVRRGDDLVEIETDKATMTYEADQDGVLRIVADEGATLAIGEVIARIGVETGPNGGGPSPDGAAAGSAPDAASAEGAPPLAVEEPSVPVDGPPAERGMATATTQDAPAPPPPSAAPARSAATPPPASDERIKASPVARRLARERGVELTGLSGSGPGGRIVKADVEAAADAGAAPTPATPEPERVAPVAEPAPAPAVAAGDLATVKGDVRVQELTRVQQVIARRMAEAKATVPEFTLQAEIDMAEAVRARDELKALAGEDAVVPSFNDMVVKASALALREFPRANGAYRDGHWELYSRVNVGVAVAGQASLVVPVVFDADSKALGEIARETRALAARVRDGTVTPPELSGGTFTVSNLGMYGVSNFTAVINPPQAAILAVGALVERPVVRDGEIVPGHVMPVTLACDHRILYGAEAAEFLGRIRALLEHPAALAL